MQEAWVERRKWYSKIFRYNARYRVEEEISYEDKQNIQDKTMFQCVCYIQLLKINLLYYIEVWIEQWDFQNIVGEILHGWDKSEFYKNWWWGCAIIILQEHAQCFIISSR